MLLVNGRRQRSIAEPTLQRRVQLEQAVHRGLNGRTDHISERHDANWHRDWDRRHAHFFHNRFFVFDNGFWFGLDPGFYPWDYLPYYAGDYYPYDYSTDVQPDYSTSPASAYQYGYYTGVQPDYNNAAVRRGLIPRSKLSKSGLLSWVITTVQSMEFSVRQRAMWSQSIRSTTS